jgi:hypothetical protein
LAEAIFPAGDLIATLRAWGVPVDDLSTAMFPTFCSLASRVDDELAVFDPDRRRRLDELSASAEKPSHRDAAFVKGCFWEAAVVAVAERPGRSQ